jgi:glycine cleavage system aminomethyltransferase T
MDASTLGKIDIQGRDAADFLERIYTNSWKSSRWARAATASCASPTAWCSTMASPRGWPTIIST